MPFSIMRSKPEYPEECFDRYPQFGQPWIFGKTLVPPAGPLEYSVRPDCEDPPYLIYELPHPLIHRDLLGKLVGAGVDNIQAFDAVLHHPSGGVMRTDYVAFNVVGLVATSELAAQVMANYEELEFETDEIEGITVDVSRIPEGILLARLADRVGRILVNDRLRDRIDTGPESGLVFFALSERDEGGTRD